MNYKEKYRQWLTFADPEPIVGKLEEDCDHCSGESCGR